jgi:threonine dehydrogenase-like Zn-dependent dehydrogenase
VDTPAKIAIVGAGPVGLEAALYARYLGYEVELFERRDRVAELCLPECDRPCVSPLAIQALSIHDPRFSAANEPSAWTAAQWRERYLRALSRSDLVADCLQLHTEVLAIGKIQIGRTDCPTGEFDRGAWDFRLLVRSGDEERVVSADVVLDCSGVEPLPLGQGGVPAAGESDHAVQTSGRIVASLSEEMLAGLGTSAAVLVVGVHRGGWRALDQLLKTDAQHRIVLAVPSDMASAQPHDWQAELQAALGTGRVELRRETWVDCIATTTSGRLSIGFGGDVDAMGEFDLIVAANGYWPRWWSELQLQIDPRTDCLLPLASALATSSSWQSPSDLVTSEPNYYVLGRKSYGRLDLYRNELGLKQIRDVFSIIGDRATLDLYEQFRPTIKR